MLGDNEKCFTYSIQCLIKIFRIKYVSWACVMSF